MKIMNALIGMGVDISRLSNICENETGLMVFLKSRQSKIYLRREMLEFLIYENTGITLNKTSARLGLESDNNKFGYDQFDDDGNIPSEYETYYVWPRRS